jgi:hypothetical protein
MKDSNGSVADEQTDSLISEEHSSPMESNTSGKNNSVIKQKKMKKCREVYTLEFKEGDIPNPVPSLTLSRALSLTLYPIITLDLKVSIALTLTLTPALNPSLTLNLR